MPNLIVQYLLFTDGQKLIQNSSFPVVANSTSSITVPPYISKPDPDHQYGFLFWNDSVNGTSLVQTDNIKIGNSDVQASAWYYSYSTVQVPPCIRVWAFSQTDNVVWPDTPIESVQPAIVWDSSNRNLVKTGLGTVDITVKAKIPGHDDQPFNKFVVFSSSPATGLTFNDLKIHANQNVSFDILAVYKSPVTICMMGAPGIPCPSGGPTPSCIAEFICMTGEFTRCPAPAPTPTPRCTAGGPLCTGPTPKQLGSGIGFVSRTTSRRSSKPTVKRKKAK